MFWYRYTMHRDDERWVNLKIQVWGNIRKRKTKKGISRYYEILSQDANFHERNNRRILKIWNRKTKEDIGVCGGSSFKNGKSLN